MTTDLVDEQRRAGRLPAGIARTRAQTYSRCSSTSSGVVNQLIQSVGEVVAQQMMDDNIGFGHVHRQQGAVQVPDMMVVNLLQQAVRQKRLIQQCFQPAVTGQVARGVQEVVLGHVQERGGVIDKSPGAC